jgi:hypothetical protein
MAVLDNIGFTVRDTGTYAAENKNARVSVFRMSSSELLRFCMNVKFRCSQGSNPDGPEMSDLMEQLNQARTEWNRRHPDLPLRDSF